MLCSIIIPIYKGNKYIKKLIDMLEQWSNLNGNIRLQIVFVNDFPEQPIVLPQFKSEYKLSVNVIENQRNMGIHYSRIIGAQYATGEYIIFLDQDDTLDENYLISQLQHLKDADAVICNGLYRNGEKIFSKSNPIKKEYSFQEYLECGYPLVSLGQLLIKRNAIPQQWFDNVIVYNGWDDHFLWALMMFHDVKVNINKDVLYVHEEDGNNTSFNWKQMSLSGQNFRDIFLKLNLMNDMQEKLFRNMIDSKVLKYEKYDKLVTLLDNVTSVKLQHYFSLHKIYKVAIYGFGVYGKILYQMLEDTDVEVIYCIDRRSDIKNANIPIIPLDEGMGKVDAIIVSVVSSFEEVEKSIKKCCSFKVISLLDLLIEINQMY